MTDKHLCVAIYLTNKQADEALTRLQFAGFGMKHLSFVGRDMWADALGSYCTGERLNYCGVKGVFWVRLWAILSGWGIFWSYGDGPLLVAGSLAESIVAAHEASRGNGNGKMTELQAGLVSIGIPMDSIVEYEKALVSHQTLLFVLGTLDEVNDACTVLMETQAINHTLHHGAADYLSLNILEDSNLPVEGDSSSASAVAN